jgi:DNA-directed RNA polymerase subunit H (RpoH/RPB5)
MIANCTIRAPRPGRVIYGGATNPWERRRQNIEEGAYVQQNQTIVRIPDPAALVARMNIPEQDIDKVRVGQPAVITLEASPGEVLTGRVSRVSPVASAEHAWLNPDKKVYEIDVALQEMPEVFIPGMSAAAHVVVGRLEQAILLPLSAVKRYKGRSFCWVSAGTGPQVREVDAGLASDRSVEIRSGLHVGEVVYLAPPTAADESELERLLGLAEQEAEEPAAGEGAERQQGPAGGGRRPSGPRTPQA